MQLNCSCNRNCFIYGSLIFHFCLISVAYSLCFPVKYSAQLPELSSMKCLYEYVASRWKPDEWNTKENELITKPVTSEPEICPAKEPKIGPPDHPNPKNTHKEVKTSDYKITNNDERKKRLSSAFTSVDKKESSQLGNSKNQVEGTRNASFDTYLNWKPVEGNWTTYGLHLEIPFTDKIFMQICAVEVAFLLIMIFGSYYYISEMKAIEKSVREIMGRAQAFAHSTAEEVSNSQRYTEIYEEIEPISNNEEHALVTLSSMIFCHLQNLANEIKKSKPEENLEKYLTEDFLRLISAHIAQDSFMKRNFQKLLPADTLLQLGQLHYHQKHRNSGRLGTVSSRIESNGKVSQQHCMGKLNRNDVKVNIGVQVGGKEIMLAQTKKEKSEEGKEKLEERKEKSEERKEKSEERKEKSEEMKEKSEEMKEKSEERKESSSD